MTWFRIALNMADLLYTNQQKIISSMLKFSCMGAVSLLTMQLILFALIIIWFAIFGLFVVTRHLCLLEEVGHLCCTLQHQIQIQQTVFHRAKENMVLILHSLKLYRSNKKTGICRNGWFSVRKRVVGEYSLCEKRWFSIESHLFLCYTRLIKSIRKKVVINLPSYPK